MDSPDTPSSDDGLNETAHALFEGLKQKLKQKAQRNPSARNAMMPDVLTEDKVAMEFAQACADRFRYCHHTAAWFEWTGSIWIQNETEVVREIIRELTRALSLGQQPKVLASVNKASFYSGVVKIAQGDEAFAVTSKHWDLDPMLLGTPVGTIDLRTGDLRAADQSDGITKTTAVAAAETADCPSWLAFLNDATGGDADLIRFLQQWAGYCLTGDVGEHSFVFIYGLAATVKASGSTPSRRYLATTKRPRRWRRSRQVIVIATRPIWRGFAARVSLLRARQKRAVRGPKRRLRA